MNKCEQCKKEFSSREKVQIKILISGMNPIFCSWDCLRNYCDDMLNIMDGAECKDFANKENKK